VRLRASLYQVLSALALATVVLIPPRTARAQTDVIRGRVTNAEGVPLANVRVTATSIPGNVTHERRTSGDGRYQIAFPGGAGDYMMGFSLVGYTFRQYEIKRTADQDVLVADARLAAVQLDTVSVVAPVQQRVNRYSTTPDVGGTERTAPATNLPAELQGNIAALAASLPGVTLIPGLDGNADGFSVLGLGANQNSVILNGVQYDGQGLPRDANISTSLSTSPYDASRGGFSGGQLSVSSRGGSSNFRTRGMSLVLNSPQLQWTDPAARALGTEFTNLSLGGVASGPIRQNKSFYNVSFQLGRQSRANQSLLNTGPLGLQTAGVSFDSVGRFLGILEDRGIPQLGGPSHQSRFSDNGSLLGSIDINPPNSVNGSSYGLSFNTNWSRTSPAGGGATSLLSSSGDRSSFSGGLQARHNRYLGLILSETNAGLTTSQSDGQPYLDLPGGRVRVSSVLHNGASGVQNLSFGGAQSLSSSSRSMGASVTNTLSWFDDANKHRIKLTSELQYSRNAQDLSNNLRGTFSFNSLEDLAAGRPASYTRELTARNRSTGQLSGALALGDTYRRSADLQFQYGIRAEANRFGASPAFNPDVQATFGVRNDIVPRRIALSPRVGFSWTLGDAQEIAAFEGAARRPRATLRGGIGVFANSSNVGSIATAVDNTGLPGGAQQLFCVGAAAPVPDWRAYALDPGSAPDRCADGTGGTVFSNSSPNVVLFAKGFAPQRSVRSNLSWTGAILDGRFNATFDAQYGVNLNQGNSVDLNFRPDVRFQLPDEGARPVFVQPTSIVQQTGAIASRDARGSERFSRVTEMRSDLRSQSTQLSVRLSPIVRTPTKRSWNVAYTYTGLREQVSGFSSTADSPLGVRWSAGGNGPHQLQYNVRYNLFNYVQVNWSGEFAAGRRYTPTIAGDVNGDGYSNDRAFIFDPSRTADAALAAGMQQLIDGSSGAARRCLVRQLGAIAGRNSCTGPWSSTATLNLTLDRVKFRMPQRASVSMSLSNPLGAADLAFNGSGNLRGWGQSAFPDQALLYVRGFDPATQRYRYEVNQRFGGTRPQLLTLRAPVSLTLSMKIDLGPTMQRQSLVQQLDYGRVQPGTRFNEANFRSFGASSVTNPMSSILRSQDSLRLTSVQADSIASMNRRYAYRADSIWTSTARYLAALPTKYRDDDAYDRYLRARRSQIDLLVDVARALQALLTPEQRRKLPASVLLSLDPRYLDSIRNGSGLYVQGASSSGMFYEGGR
jgi:hypothetical protein